MLGVTAVALAVEAGAYVTAEDIDEQRLAAAARFGAVATQAPQGLDPAPPGGRQLFDLVLEFSGAASAVQAGVRSLDIGGTLVLAGTVSPGPALVVEPQDLVRGWHTITGVHNYEPHHLQAAVAALTHTADRYPWHDLVAAPVPLRDLPELITRRHPHAPRSAVRPDL